MPVVVIGLAVICMLSIILANLTTMEFKLQLSVRYIVHTRLSLNGHGALGYWRDNKAHTDSVWSKGHLRCSVRKTEGRISDVTRTSCIGKIISEYITSEVATHPPNYYDL